VPLTDANYEVDIERFKQRYDNRSLVIQSHIRLLLETPYVEHPSAKELQTLHAYVSAHLAALKALDQPTDQWDAWLVTIIVIRLDTATTHGWQLRQLNTQLPKYNDLEAFLMSRCVAFENSEAYFIRKGQLEVSSQSIGKGNVYEKKVKRVLLATQNTPVDKYPCCAGFHRIYSCEKFKGLSVNDRLTIVRKAHLCFNCLSSFHMSNACNSKGSCDRCGLKHNSLLHVMRQQQSISQNENAQVQNDDDRNLRQSLSCNASSVGK